MSELVHFDNAATSFPKPDAVLDAVTDAARRLGSSPGRSGSDDAVAAGRLIDETRLLLHGFLGAPGDDADRVVFTANATDALNLVFRGLCRPGDHVVSSRLEHNSVLRPLAELTARGHITHDLVPFDSKGFVCPDTLAAALRPETRLVVLTHASNVLGTIQDVASVGRLCRERGVLFCVDTAQTAGAAPVAMADWPADIVVFTGHKSLLGPPGIGGLIVAPDVDIDSSRWGGTGVRSNTRRHLEEFPYRLEAGTPNLWGIAGLRAAVEWIEDRGLAVISTLERQLMSQLLDGIDGIDGVRALAAGADDRHVGVVSVVVDGMPADEAGTRLDVDHRILVRTGLQCAPLVHQDLGTTATRGTVRFGFGPFNTSEHVDRALAGLAECAEAAARRC